LPNGKRTEDGKRSLALKDLEKPNRLLKASRESTKANADGAAAKLRRAAGAAEGRCLKIHNACCVMVNIADAVGGGDDAPGV